MDIAVGLVIIIGGVIPYSHQSYRIIRYKSAEGMSLYSAALNFFTSWLLAMNITIVMWNKWAEPAPLWVMTERTVALAQIYGSVVFTGMTGFFIAKYTESEYKTSITSVSIVLCLTFFLVSFLTYYVGFFFEYGTILGIVSSVFTAIIWLPQVVILFKNKATGQLSFVLVIFEAFGSILVVFYQAIMVREHWSTWISTLVLSVEQFVLLGLYIRYHYFTTQKSLLDEMGIKKK